MRLFTRRLRLLDELKQRIVLQSYAPPVLCAIQHNECTASNDCVVIDLLAWCCRMYVFVCLAAGARILGKIAPANTTCMQGFQINEAL